MKTLVVDKHTDLKGLASKSDSVKPVNPVTEENRQPKFVAGNPVNKDSTQPAEAGQPVAATGDAVAAVVPAQPEEGQKAGLNLEGTLKVVEDLHKRVRYRDRLLSEIGTLEAFDIALKEDEGDEDLDSARNFYQGCELTIRDGKGRVFMTRNATVIWTTSQMVNSLFVDKLTEIESGIVLPRA